MKVSILAGGQTAEATGTLGSAEHLIAAGEEAGHEVKIAIVPPDSTPHERISVLSALLDQEL